MLGRHVTRPFGKPTIIIGGDRSFQWSGWRACHSNDPISIRPCVSVSPLSLVSKSTHYIGPVLQARTSRRAGIIDSFCGVLILASYPECFGRIPNPVFVSRKV